MNRKQQQEIAMEISPLERKKIEIIKGLSVEECYLLKKKRYLGSLPIIFFFISAIFYWPVSLGLKATSFTTLRISYLVFIFSIYKSIFFSIGLIIPIIILVVLMDKFGMNYFKKSSTLRKELKKKLHNNATTTTN